MLIYLAIKIKQKPKVFSYDLLFDSLKNTY